MTTKTLSPLVAVIMRTKDRPVLLERAINSVANQTFSDYILVIINDGGQQRAVDELIDKYGSKIKGKIKVIHNEKSLGMEPASNKAIKSTDSKYVTIHDDDDSWSPQFLETTIKHLETNNVFGVVVTTDRVIEEVTDEGIDIIRSERWHPELHHINFYKMCLDNFATPITFIYRRDIYKEIGYYDESLPAGVDWVFGLRFLTKHDIDFIDTENALAFYHHREKATGVNANSVYLDSQEKKINVTLNKLLREDISSGSLGLGYLVNSIRINHEMMSKITRLQEVGQQSLNKQESVLNGMREQIVDLQRVVIDRTHAESDARRVYNLVLALPLKILHTLMRK